MIIVKPALRIAEFAFEMVLVVAKPTLKLVDSTLQPTLMMTKPAFENEEMENMRAETLQPDMGITKLVIEPAIKITKLAIRYHPAVQLTKLAIRMMK